jgi:2-oxoglutarate dehydrogenase E1 component
MDSMYDAWQKDPTSVHVSWQAYFKNVSKGSKIAFVAPPTLIPSGGILHLETDQSGSAKDIMDTMKVQLMVRAFQVRGHEIADLDPLKITFDGKSAPELTPAYYGFTEADMDRKFYLGILKLT